ncbi:MAG TPA: NUDIX hydrolase [Thermoanaerobaculia bacterium]|nr:NUDIX hydrolase [Thermoanaerobaculia bacterium]
MRTLLAILFATMTAAPAGYWPDSKANEILAKTESIRLAPDLSHLTAGERTAVKDLLEVGAIFQSIYEESRHHQALAAYKKLEARGDRKLLDIYRLFQGPIATTLDNKREAIAPVDPQVPGRNVYPIDAKREVLEGRADLLGERTVVRRATKTNIDRDLAMIAKYPLLAALHPNLAATLKNAKAFYAVPYSVAYADQLVRASKLLMHAADAVESSDEEFARYLRNRSRDLLSNDYESGDASWVTGHFKHLNAQLGAYETYDDALFGVKAFHAVSVLVANDKATEELRRALGGLQAIEDALPYESHKRIREDIPVGVYEVIADFAQARGTNTATILPNDPLFSRRYGRTILLRENIMRHPAIFAADLRVWRAATTDAHANDLADDGNFQRTLWHEIGHYLGVDRDRNGRTLDVALEDFADATEEMKADLVSLFALQRMNHPSLRAIQASGIRRTLQNVKPRRDQPYQTMQLVQFNWFLEHGLIEADPRTARLTIHYDKYADVVTSLLREVLKLQHDGDKAATAKFFDRWTVWGDPHENLAARIREAQGARFRLVRYAALGE